MQIEPATCPACGAHYDPLRARAVTVVDGRVRAFCSPACRDRALTPQPPPLAAPHAPSTDAHVPIVVPRAPLWRGLPREYRVLAAAALTALGAFVALIVAGKRHLPPPPPLAATAAPAHAAAVAPAPAPAAGPDVWMQPLAGRHRVLPHDRHIFPQGSGGVPAAECADGHCAVDIEASPGEMVMAVHDGVVEAIERDPAAGDGRGRYVRLNHHGGAMASMYLQLDGIREDLRPGIPVKLGEPIGTVAATAHPHLRFAVSVRDAGDGKELFINPEPLLALWPGRKHAATSLHGMEKAADVAR